MPDAILIIVTVQTVPGLKNLWTCPMTGSAPNAISTPINTTLLTVFIVGRFLGEDAVTATEGRRLPLHPGFYAAHECWGTLDVAARRLEAAERGSTAVGDGDRPPLWCLFNSAHRTAEPTAARRLWLRPASAATYLPIVQDGASTTRFHLDVFVVERLVVASDATRSSSENNWRLPRSNPRVERQRRAGAA